MSALKGYEIVAVQQDAAIMPGEVLLVECPCRQGKVLIGGGADAQSTPPGSAANYTLKSSFPINNPGAQKWAAVWTNATPENIRQVVAFTVYAICVDES
jgi:hypothetical protein